MTETTKLYNNVAPLANVVRLQALVDRCLSRAHGLPGMGCYYGPAGYGKTTAGIYVTNKLNACHVQALPFGGTKKLFEMIVAELGLRPARTVSALFDLAARELAETGRTLIIDEADQILTDRTIEAVRHLHDVSGAPLILMGEELLPQRLKRWDRVHGRILNWVPAEPATADDVGHLANIYAKGIEIGPDLKAALLAASRGSIRNVSTNLDNLREFAAIRGLQRLGMKEWGDAAWHTGEAPAARRNLAPVPLMPSRRRTAA